MSQAAVASQIAMSRAMFSGPGTGAEIALTPGMLSLFLPPSLPNINIDFFLQGAGGAEGEPKESAADGCAGEGQAEAEAAAACVAQADKPVDSCVAKKQSSVGAADGEGGVKGRVTPGKRKAAAADTAQPDAVMASKGAGSPAGKLDNESRRADHGQEGVSVARRPSSSPSPATADKKAPRVVASSGRKEKSDTATAVVSPVAPAKRTRVLK